MASVALHEPFEAIPNAKHLDAAEDSANRGRPDHAVDPRRRATATHNAEALDVGGHRHCPPWAALPLEQALSQGEIYILTAFQQSASLLSAITTSSSHPR
jgi:predicted dienelactone hydrolase